MIASIRFTQQRNEYVAERFLEDQANRVLDSVGLECEKKIWILNSLLTLVVRNQKTGILIRMDEEIGNWIIYLNVPEYYEIKHSKIESL